MHRQTTIKRPSPRPRQADIVVRLRERVVPAFAGSTLAGAPMSDIAADEIERLRPIVAKLTNEVERLRRAVWEAPAEGPPSPVRPRAVWLRGVSSVHDQT